MAFLKDIETRSGAKAKYWNIAEYVYNYTGNSLRVVFNGYVDGAARRANKETLDSFEVVFDGENFQPDLNRADIYRLVKNMDKFSGATDE